MQTNVLCYGDNLDILHRYLPDAAVELVYLDPQIATDAQLLVFGQASAGLRANSAATYDRKGSSKEEL